MISSVVGVGFE